MTTLRNDLPANFRSSCRDTLVATGTVVRHVLSLSLSLSLFKSDVTFEANQTRSTLLTFDRDVARPLFNLARLTLPFSAVCKLCVRADCTFEVGHARHGKESVLRLRGRMRRRRKRRRRSKIRDESVACCGPLFTSGCESLDSKKTNNKQDATYRVRRLKSKTVVASSKSISMLCTPSLLRLLHLLDLLYSIFQFDLFRALPSELSLPVSCRPDSALLSFVIMFLI
jgi:hypothetical protein